MESGNTGDLLAKVLNMADLVEYQEGSVVSKTIIDKKIGTLTVFAFSKGQGLSEHTAPFDALVYILDGSAEITIAGKYHQVGTGEMIIMPADKPHALTAIKQFKMLLVMIRS
ncbi:MAG: cupin domain-containing protein [Chloroflexi bacterium]|jgi:quercetin dioxygenase-like cupin family protein|nr:cupin domain-containing protein [Chloroflexota bacterium]MBT7081486.1 cupin domain-containing protein [Chloroflexota bacterium]MBT7290694.1 cupin domain-containing protein [Chloroflexota bacterium]